jgi:hypothetical protein
VQVALNGQAVVQNFVFRWQLGRVPRHCYGASLP